MDANGCLNRMLDADRELYTRCINSPEFSKAFNDLVVLAGERGEVVAHAERLLHHLTEADRLRADLVLLVNKYRSG